MAGIGPAVEQAAGLAERLAERQAGFLEVEAAAQPVAPKAR